eukprot:385205_1
MNVLVFLSCLIYSSYSDSSSGDPHDSSYDDGCAGHCDLSYNDTSTSASTCPSAAFILNLYHQGFIAAGLQTAQEIKTYFEPYYDSGIIYRGNGRDTFIGLDALAEGFVVQTWALTRKEAYNLKNERYGEHYVAVDFEISFSNICDDHIDNVQSFAIFYCDDSGKITNYHVLRDQTDNIQFLTKTAQCIAQNLP